MNMAEYLQRLEELLRAGRMAPRDIEDAVTRCGQHIIDAGPDHEAETLADMGTPEELAQEILEDYRNMNRRPGGLGLGGKIVMGVVLSPFIVAGYGIVLGLVLGGAACMVAGGFAGVVGLGALLPGGLWTFLNFLGGGFAAAGAGLLLVLAGILFFKLCNLCMRRLFGGRRA